MDKPKRPPQTTPVNNQNTARKLVNMAAAGVELVDKHAVGQVPTEDGQVLQAFAAAILATYLNGNTTLSSKIQSFTLTVRAVYLYGRAQGQKEAADGQTTPEN